MTIITPRRYQHVAALAPRATPEDAKMLSRLADRAQALAILEGKALTRKDAIKRVRGNVRYVRQLAERKGVEW